ncbi:MAG: radical SAM protein [Lachnospiraceae bacterium]|jgi:uncharacterized protein|nr:radical SAM protein [Lachnospiraceae bacterium]
MLKTMKMSKYNFVMHDQNGNMIIYNFLTGMRSLLKIMKQDVEKFTNLFLTNSDIDSSVCEKYREAVKSMLELGILVPDNVDESVSQEELHYSETYDSKLSLIILPTGKCMFRCPYCYEGEQIFHRESMTIDDQDALVKFVQRNISKHTALNINWFGGEPLLEADTIKYLSDKFIQICNTRHIPYSAEMTTNGYLLNADMFDMLYKLRVYTYMITLDGFKEQHDRVKCTCDGKGSYDTILNNLLRIRDNKHYKFAHIIVRINVSKNVLNKLDDFVEYIASLFADDSRFEITFAAVVSYSESSLYDKYVDSFEMHERLFQNKIFMEKIYNEEFKIHQLIPEKKCVAALRNAYVITSDLGVYKCYTYFESDDNKVGHINLKSDFVIDETKHKRWYLPNRYVQKISEACSNCFYLPCCRYVSPGCPIQYTQKQRWQSCILEKENYKDDLASGILYAIDKHPFTMLALK